MPIATTPSPNAGVAGAGHRHPRANWTSLLADRLLPAAATAFILAAQIAVTSSLALSAWSGGMRAAALPGLLDSVLTALFLALVASLFALRLPARSRERRPLAIAVAVAGTGSLYAGTLLGTLFGGGARGPLAGAAASPFLDVAAAVLLAFGMAVAIWSLRHLGRSFAVLPEARRLVTSGPYGWMRNPLYVGELIAAVGILLPRFGVYQAALLALFAGCQLARVGWEEEVLGAHFGAEFAAYRRRVPRFLPKPTGGRRGRGS